MNRRELLFALFLNAATLGNDQGKNGTAEK